jgi:hypothetical protein
MLELVDMGNMCQNLEVQHAVYTQISHSTKCEGVQLVRTWVSSVALVYAHTTCTTTPLLHEAFEGQLAHCNVWHWSTMLLIKSMSLGIGMQCC